MSPFKAEAFLERMKDQLGKARQDPAWQIVMLPVRPPQETKFEVIVIEGDEVAGKIEARQAIEILQEQQKAEKDGKQVWQTFPSLELTTDYILLHLGAPVVKIELDPLQISLCYNKAVEEIKQSPRVESDNTIMDGALAHAKIILGRVRCKFVPLPSDHSMMTIMDGPSLLAEGERDLLRWRKRIAGVGRI